MTNEVSHWSARSIGHSGKGTEGKNRPRRSGTPSAAEAVARERTWRRTVSIVRSTSDRRGRGTAAVAMAFALGAALASAGCGTERPIIAVEDGSIPSMPTPMPGKAMLTGVVRDGTGTAVVGAPRRIGEPAAPAPRDATGACAIAVPADSTVTRVARADVSAKPYEESVMRGAGTAGSLALRLLAPADITAKSAMAG